MYACKFTLSRFCGNLATYSQEYAVPSGVTVEHLETREWNQGLEIDEEYIAYGPHPFSVAIFRHGSGQDSHLEGEATLIPSQEKELASLPDARHVYYNEL